MHLPHASLHHLSTSVTYHSAHAGAFQQRMRSKGLVLADALSAAFLRLPSKKAFLNGVNCTDARNASNLSGSLTSDSFSLAVL